jgi:catechol 2,3-dioxygenase-like lactoylglutathione lyase family enzyme
MSNSTQRPVGLHHVAYACKDVEATRHFYEDLCGFSLVHTEVTRIPDTESFFRHLFFDLGDGSCIAFFDMHGMGEKPDWKSDLSDSVGLPIWVNHIAFNADEERQQQARASLSAGGVEPIMDVDHGWCHSLYYVDPNGIMVEFCRDTPGYVPDSEAARKALLDN